MMEDKFKRLDRQDLEELLALYDLDKRLDQVIENIKISEELIPIDESQEMSLAKALDDLQKLQNDADGVEQ